MGKIAKIVAISLALVVSFGINISVNPNTNIQGFVGYQWTDIGTFGHGPGGMTRSLGHGPGA
ncbi:hypothetical protein QD47_28530 [Paenibacillus terrae]|uniref:Uncharacterized protein n=1 Tax=Paenibacillus terrae TaxID=159743 RepID=A0A0D7WXB1_9BACL|nr:hypothetical protein QD47_28530 [Paenibacillus terrae]